MAASLLGSLTKRYKCRRRQQISVVFFFFQAEDGIRDADVTGVQTCALPISLPSSLPPSSPCRTLGGGGGTAPRTSMPRPGASSRPPGNGGKRSTDRLRPIAPERENGVLGKKGDLRGRRIIKKKKNR